MARSKKDHECMFSYDYEWMGFRCPKCGFVPWMLGPARDIDFCRLGIKRPKRFRVADRIGVKDAAT